MLAGRSLPYGEGVTYWPIAEMVKVAAGITDDDPVQEAVAKLRACCDDEAVADLLALAVGVLEAVETERSTQEIAWAAREWAAELADAQPLVLVFEDVHWAEEPLLDLIEHLGRARQGHAAADRLPRPARAARRPARLGRRAPARRRDRARAARPASRAKSSWTRCSPTGSSRRPSARRCSRRPRATRSSSRRRRGCCSRAARRRSGSPTRCRR